MKKIVRPLKGLSIKNPATKRNLDPKGEAVVINSYWRRRLAAGEVEHSWDEEEPKPTTDRKNKTKALETKPEVKEEINESPDEKDDK